MNSRFFDDIATTIRHIAEMIADRARHAARGVHAKSHGLLRAELSVNDGIKDPLRQGLFANPGKYPAIMRFSTNPGDMLPDSISTHARTRGEGDRCERRDAARPRRERDPGFRVHEHEGVSGEGRAEFLKQLKILEQHATDFRASEADRFKPRPGSPKARLKRLERRARH